MQKKLSTLFQNTAFIWSFLALIFLILNLKLISLYWSLPIVGGWDGSGHAAVGQYYAEHIFPNTWGWIPSWFFGMPFPQFYPPLFFFLVAFLSKIFFFTSYTTVFKAFVIFLQLLLPGLMAWVTKDVAKSIRAAWIAGLLTVLVSSAPYFGLIYYGLVATSTFNTGFVAQLLGFTFFFIVVTVIFANRN